MSEYQYYEFQAVDRPLNPAEQEALRAISSRAEITATSFTNHYEWGDLKGDPRKLVEQWFDLHVYVANWGSRRFIVRVPRRFLNEMDPLPFIRELDGVEVTASGANLIVDISVDDESGGDWDDGTGWLAALAPLRADVMAGDLRLFYLLWLTAVQYELIAEDAVEPLPGIGPLTGALRSFADFLYLDPDLVEAAAEQGVTAEPLSNAELRTKLAAIPEAEKVELLARIVEGDPYLAVELKRSLVGGPISVAGRTVGALRERAGEVAKARERAEAERLEAEQRRRRKEAEDARRARVNALRQRGERVWQEVEQDIELRHASGYDKAARCLADLGTLAREEGNQAAFDKRLASIRLRHAAKRTFIARLDALDRQ